jgi:Zn-dependent protease with chaperone function
VPEQRDLHDPSAKSSLIIFGATGLFLFLFFFQVYRVGIPTAVDWVVENLPAGIFEAVGEQSINTLSSSEWQPSALDSGRQHHLRTLLMQNYNGSLKPPGTTLYFRHAEDYANALALPGGHIVLTDGLVHTLESDAAIHAVFLHELGHAYHKHPEKSLVRSALFSLGLALLVADLSAVSALLVEASGSAVSASYSREDELEADQFAAKILLLSSDSTAALRLALTKLDTANEEKGLNWWRSHPLTRERIAALEVLDALGSD